MKTIFESEAKQPNPDLLEAELYNLNVVAADRKKKADIEKTQKKAEQSLFQFFESEYQTQVFSVKEAVSIVFGNQLKNEQKYLASMFLIEKTGMTQAKAIDIFGLLKNSLYGQHGKYIDAAQKSQIKKMDSLYLRLMNFFRTEAKQVIDKPTTIILKSAV